MPFRIPAALLAILTTAAAFGFSEPAPVVAGGQKVAIIVGPVGSMTNSYRSQADQVAREATAAGATVTKAYSPNATWANVKAAVNGANILVYFGHGNGSPSPYSSTEQPDRNNGWGINRTTTNGDGDSWGTTMVYCGEKALLGTLTSASVHQWNYCGGKTNTDGITPAPGFTMVYAQAHYTGGWGERYVESDPKTTLTQAQQRVRNYSYPALMLGANGYIATAYGDADDIVRRVLTGPNRTYAQIYADGIGFNADEQVHMAHPDIADAEVWVQETVAWSMHFGDPDYWYAFAGNPNRTPSGAVVPSRITRYAGADRYATAAAVSAATFSPGVPVAYVATRSNFPDALAAGAAAAHLGAPVLLATFNRVTSATVGELTRLQPATIKVIGGSSVISDGVLEALRTYTTTGVVDRIAGADRYATAAAVSADAFDPGVAVAYLATGRNFPDALAGVAAAGKDHGPILLTRPGDLPAETAAELSRLGPQRIVVLGGPSVVSDAVITALEPHTSGSVTRLAGDSRYSTAAAISAATFTSATTVYVATGANFPDALGGGAVAGGIPAPLLLVPGASIPEQVAAEVRRLFPERIVILGGPSAVSAGVAYQLARLIER